MLEAIFRKKSAINKIAYFIETGKNLRNSSRMVYLRD
jgi:hypothetical protein